MIIIDGTKEIEYEGRTSVAIGKFDGVHKGHRELIKHITSDKEKRKSLVFTFSYDSDCAFKEDEKLLTEDERRGIFESLGVDYLVEFLLDEKNAGLEPEKFVEEILVKRLHAGKVVAGADVSFGYKGRGNAELLCKLGDSLGFEVEIIEKVNYKGEAISSTRIRKALAEGYNKDAEDMLK